VHILGKERQKQGKHEELAVLVEELENLGMFF